MSASDTDGLLVSHSAVPLGRYKSLRFFTTGLMCCTAALAIALVVVSVKHNTSEEHANAFDHLESYVSSGQPGCEDAAPITEEERQDRMQRMRAVLVDEGYDAFVTEPGATMRYFTDIEWKFSERPFLLVIPASSDKDVFMVVPDFERFKADDYINGRYPMETWQEDESPYDTLWSALGSTGNEQILVDHQMRNFIVEGLKTSSLVVPPMNVEYGFDQISKLRMAKTDAEIAILRCVNMVTKEIHTVMEDLVDVGWTEDDAKVLVDQGFRKAGLRTLFTLILFGPNAAYPHGTDTPHYLEDGEFALLDLGADLYGYQSDISRTYLIGEVSEERKDIWRAVYQAQAAAIHAIQDNYHEGFQCQEADRAAREVIGNFTSPLCGTDGEPASCGQFFSHRLGHGIGMEGHEDPYLVNGDERLLQHGNTVTVEPGIYIINEDGPVLGVRLEDVVMASDDGGVDVFGELPVPI